jgi:dTDP-4-dehydrorhamnose reductase
LRVVVTGAGGMVGQAVSQYCESSGDEVLSYDRQSLNIADGVMVEAILEKDRPDAVINCAAWTDVDGCEFDPARAHAVNATGPENLANASRRVGAVLVTISTDYVFDGKKEGFYTQRDAPNPESVYGVSKLAGERRAQQAHARTIVVRTGFVFGPGGKNFLSTVLDRARRGEQLRAISDAYGTPTYSRHLAMRLRELAQMDLPGFFHVVNAGEGASYEEFARAALKTAEYPPVSIETVTMGSLERPAPRPKNSRLKCLLSEAIGLEPLPSWLEALRDFAAVDTDKEIAASS